MLTIRRLTSKDDHTYYCCLTGQDIEHPKWGLEWRGLWAGNLADHLAKDLDALRLRIAEELEASDAIGDTALVSEYQGMLADYDSGLVEVVGGSR